MKALRVVVASGLLSFMTMFANIVIGPTCWATLHQPEVPECLRK